MRVIEAKPTRLVIKEKAARLTVRLRFVRLILLPFHRSAGILATRQSLQPRTQASNLGSGAKTVVAAFTRWLSAA